MSIDSLRDGYVRLCFDPSLNVYRGKCRILIEGQFYDPDLGCEVTPDVPIRVAATRDIDCQFGEGSVLAESLKTAFACCPNNAVEIWALPREDAASAVKAVYTMTVQGTALTAGRLDIFWGDGRYNISVRVYEGDSDEDIADAIVAAIPSNFPYTATASAGAITLTARNGGKVGNYLNPMVNWHGRLDYMPAGVTVATVQTTPGSVDPAAIDYNTALGECCYCCIAGLYENAAWQDALIAYVASAWDCDKPQCFGHAYTYNPGSLGQILSSATNSSEISRMAHCNTDPNFPWLKVAAYAAKSCCVTADNPEISIQGSQFGVLSCILAPQSCSQCFTFDEQEQLREAGFVVTVPVSGGQGAMTSPQVTNDVTNYLYDVEGRQDSTWRDVNRRRIDAKVASEFAIQLQKYNGLGLFTKNTNIPTGVKGTNPRLVLSGLRAWYKTQIGILFSEPDNLDEDLTVSTDFEKAPQCQGVPGKLHVLLVYRPPVRINQIQVNAQPKLLDNCNA